MATMAREAWTDERLDDLKAGMHHEFDRVDRRFEQVDRQFDRVHAEIGELRADANARFDALNARFDALNRTLIGVAGAIVAAIVAAGLF